MCFILCLFIDLINSTLLNEPSWSDFIWIVISNVSNMLLHGSGGRIKDWHGTWALSLGMAPGQGMGMAPGWGMTLGIALDIAMGHGTGHDQPSGAFRSSVRVKQ